MIRRALPDDAVEIARLMLEHPLWQQYGLQLEEQATRLAKLIPAKTSYVYDGDAGLSGFVIFDTSTFGNNGYIQLIGVKHGETGTGIGKLLLQHAHREMARVTNRAFLLCTSTNTGAQRFYERNGYEKVGELPDWLIPGITEYMYVNRNLRN